MNYSRREQFKKALTVVGILAAVLVIGIPISLGFYLSTESHLVLREAKNAKLALEMVALTQTTKNIYDADASGGMAEGVWEGVSPYVEEGCVLSLDGFDTKTRQVTALTYSNKNFRVVYTVNDNGKHKWEIDYLIKIQEYTDQD